MSLQATLKAAIGRRVYDVPRFVSDQLAINAQGRLRWPIGWESPE